MEGNFGPLPYYLFYLGLYRSSRKVQSMGYVQRGLYRELLDECWVKGYIPDNIKELAKICHCPPSRFAQAWPRLSKCFIPLEPGKLESERMSKEALRVLQIIESRSRSGQKGGLQRVENSNNRDANARKSQANAMPVQANASSRVEIEEYIDKSIYSSTARKRAKNDDSCKPKNQEPKPTSPTSYSDPGIPCAQCGNFAGYANPNDPPDAIYVCSPECLRAYESKATSSKTGEG
jgi:uncharacterized protein YdaU (DUF1376 family)